MKKGIRLALTLAIIMTLASCGPKESAQAVVQNAIESVKNMDIKSMKSYWGQDKLTDAFSMASSEETDSDSLAMLKLLVKNLDYQIIETSEADDTAKVTVQITNLDMSQVMSEFVAAAFENTLSYTYLPDEQKPTDKEVETKYIEMMCNLLEREGTPTVTNTVEIELSLVDKKWVINYNVDAIDAMLGGLNTLSESMNDAFSESSN